MIATLSPKKTFQSTLPARGATEVFFMLGDRLKISIHAPRTGSDHENGLPRDYQFRISIHAPRTGSDDESASAFCNLWHFNPRSPHGERPFAQKSLQKTEKFQSTLPARGATWSRFQ